jgi:hypothetical protein
MRPCLMASGFSLDIIAHFRSVCVCVCVCVCGSTCFPFNTYCSFQRAWREEGCVRGVCVCGGGGKRGAERERMNAITFHINIVHA